MGCGSRRRRWQRNTGRQDGARRRKSSRRKNTSIARDSTQLGSTGNRDVPRLSSAAGPRRASRRRFHRSQVTRTGIWSWRCGSQASLARQGQGSRAMGLRVPTCCLADLPFHRRPARDGPVVGRWLCTTWRAATKHRGVQARRNENCPREEKIIGDHPSRRLVHARRDFPLVVGTGLGLCGKRRRCGASGKRRRKFRLFRERIWI